MTYEKFRDIEYYVDKEYYYYVRHKDDKNFPIFEKRRNKINNFVKKVLTETLKNIPNNYFDWKRGKQHE